MQLGRLASVLVLLGVVPACSAIVSPDTTRLGGGPDTGTGTLDSGMVRPDTGVRTDGGPGNDTGGGGCAGGCADSFPCTIDSCNGSTCMHVPDDAVCGAGMRCSATLGCVSSTCSSDAECSDGNACNGAETCSPGSPGADASGCLDGTPPDCNDRVDCTADDCNSVTGCVHEAHDSACDDTFGCTTDTCAPGGCVHVTNDAMCNGGCLSGAVCQVGAGCVGGSPSTCPADGNPCTSDPTMCDPGTATCLHPPRDDDRDGHAIMRANGSMGTVTCPGGDDCNDMSAAIHPGATELCNGIDDNCDGNIDESGGLPPGPDDCSSETAIMVSSSGGPARAGMVTGSNVDDSDDYVTMCGHDGGLDAVYYVDIPAGGAVDVTFTTDNPNTTFDTVLGATVGNTCGNFDTRLCNDDITGSNNRSRLNVCVPGGAGTRVHVLVDGFDGSATGNYQLNVTITPRATGFCG